MRTSEAQYRCESCRGTGSVSSLTFNRWGDPCCPSCGSLRVARLRSRLSAILSIYFYFNVV